ncbi:MAG: hypothetical protein M3Y83_05755 [Actinomycetota bacterium]|nr:hypothetical protein [Actinomycetota bacterium]
MRLLRWLLLLLGTVAVLVGAIGLLTPVNVGVEDVGCGSAILPDLTAARAATDFGGANIPVLDEVVANPDYEELCRMELEDRRVWTVTVASVGAVVLVGAGVMVFAARRTGTGSRLP